MRKLLLAGAVMTLGWVAVSLTIGAAEDEKPKYTIKQVMKAAHAKGKLKDKVVDGTATDDEKAKLVEYYEALALNKPPKGSAESWKEKTTALITAAKDTAAGKEGAIDKLKAAANCKSCHDEHRLP